MSLNMSLNKRHASTRMTTSTSTGPNKLLPADQLSVPINFGFKPLSAGWLPIQILRKAL
jgi:hypothetical protein